MSFGMVHANNNLICAIDCETTGLIPGHHEIFEISIIPLDAQLEPSKSHSIFNITIRPNYINRIEYDALRINRVNFQNLLDTAVTQTRAFELFESWFEKLRLPMYKKIIPLGYNICAFDLLFIKDWMGPKNCEHYIFNQARDGFIVANYLNDVSAFFAEQTPFSKLKLKLVCHALGIEVHDRMTHDPTYDAYLSAKVYKKLIVHPLMDYISNLHGRKEIEDDTIWSSNPQRN